MRYLLIIICLLPIGAQADNSRYVPRASYLYSDDLLGNHAYLGVAYLSVGKSRYKGLSLRYADGELGEKYNLSYTEGVSTSGYDLGISYIKQDETTEPKLDGKHKGWALEADLRVLAVFFTFTVAKDITYVTTGYGF